MTLKNIIFDLDGTLIDSAPSILASIQVALDNQGLNAVRPLTADLIGPPLDQVLQLVAGPEQLTDFGELKDSFVRYYDATGCLGARVYDGIHNIIHSLKERNFNLYIATNKRGHPTRRIVNHLGWAGLFADIYSLDRFSPPALDKSVMLQEVLKEMLPSQNAMYVGDRHEDADAARVAGIPFVFAMWGYGIKEDVAECEHYVQCPRDLEAFICAF